MCIALIGLFVVALAIADPIRGTDQVCAPVPEPGCFVQAKRDVAFIIDRSGSVGLRGQTYNIEIGGLVRALRDRTVIPRDGSTAIVVVLFNGAAAVSVASDDLAGGGRLKGIESDEQAEMIAAKVEQLRCVAKSDAAAPPPCPSGDTNFDAAISTAADYLIRHGRPDARRILLISTDGQPTDVDGGLRAAAMARELARVSELDAILVGLDPGGPINPVTGTNEFQEGSAKIARIVFPQPPGDLPGAALAVAPGPCNQPGADSEDPDCARQAGEFSEHVRRFLRGDVATIELVVTTSEDMTDANGLSLRRAIERANCNGGKAIITFAAGIKGKTISPRIPLPALTAPDITIDGIGKCDGRDCEPSVTIDGSRVNATSGEAHGDGILIRSNHAVVRGLKIVNFKRSGVAVAPICPSDNVGCNRIELNMLADNAAAGVLILDPASGPGRPPSHNVGNTVTRNSISGSLTPIDLGGDGATPNDPGDADEGPDTLLNFPLILSAARVGDKVTLEGRAAANEVIEVFRITRLKPGSAEPAIDSIEFAGEATADSEGEFIAADLPVSPTGFYTATATAPSSGDSQCRNTSELAALDGGGCTLPPTAVITPEGNDSILKFGPAAARKKSKKSDENAKTFTIENVGCDQLVVSFESIQRTGSDVDSGKITDTNDGSFFSVSIINADGTLTDFAKAPPVVISRGARNARRFKVFFHPVIPPVTGRVNGLSAAEVLPDAFRSVLDIKLINGGGQRRVAWLANVDTAAQLINSNAGRPRRPPLVTLTRSGDIITVTFYVYDSDLSVNRVKYEFHDGAGRVVDLNQPDPVLNPAGLVRGQSYKVEQKFSNAKQHPEIVNVRVTISDGGREDSADSGPLAVQAAVGSVNSSGDSRGAALTLPTAELPEIPKPHTPGQKNLAAVKQSATPARNRPGGFTQLRAARGQELRLRKDQR
ncbi:MAG: hypothetical protein ACLGJB_19635 [Blastocatellia bacterium]